MKHYIQYDAEDNTLALYRLWEGKRIKITNLSEEDLDAIEYQYKLYKKNKIVTKRLLEQAIHKEENYINYITGNIDNTEIGKELLDSAKNRLNCLKEELNDDRNREGVVGYEGRIISNLAYEEEGIGRQIDDLYP
jgi:hypothetical protein